MKRVIAALDEAHARLAEADLRQHEPLAIVGMAARCPLGDDPEELWQHYCQDAMRFGRSIAGPWPRTTAPANRTRDRHASAKLPCCRM